jgi:hypothetical protein
MGGTMRKGERNGERYAATIPRLRSGMGIFPALSRVIHQVWSTIRPLRSGLGTVAMLVRIMLDLFALYVLAGVIVALAFVTAGLAAVLPAGTPVTIGARILFLPAATALWPIVLSRWLRLRGPR